MHFLSFHELRVGAMTSSRSVSTTVNSPARPLSTAFVHRHLLPANPKPMGCRRVACDELHHCQCGRRPNPANQGKQGLPHMGWRRGCEPQDIGNDGCRTTKTRNTRVSNRSGVATDVCVSGARHGQEVGHCWAPSRSTARGQTEGSRRHPTGPTQ